MNRFCVLAVLACLTCSAAVCTADAKGIYEEFRAAPDSTRTKLWWFHGETPTTHEGITADLEAFKEAGVGGVVYYDQVHGDAEGAFPVFSPEWWDALIFSASEADRLNLTFEINLSNGFVAGGPWITEEMSMKRLCSSSVILNAGESWKGSLPAPSSRKYWDICVLAFPEPENVLWEEKVLVSATERFDSDTCLVFDFGRPFTARSLTYSEYNTSKHSTGAMNMPGPPGDAFYGDGYVDLPPIGSLEVSDDGVHFRKVRDIPAMYHLHFPQKTIAFEAVTGRWFRINLKGWNRPDGQRRRDLELGRMVLSSAAMTDEWENLAGLDSDYPVFGSTPEYGTDEVIDPSRIIDISCCLGKDGKLDWTAPGGNRRWIVLRIAQTSTGGHTKHGRPGQMGLECDKLLKDAARLQWDNFAAVIIDSLSSCGLKPDGVIMDSHEMGSQNWTFGYDEEFMKLRGYDVTDYFPALLGYVTGSAELSSHVLFDHRRTLAWLENHRYFAALDTLAMEAGVMLTAQATGNGQSMTSDNISAKGSVRRPQGEFWAKHKDGCYDIKEVASAAHVYGKSIASAEAFTDAKYSQSLGYLKTLADYAYAFHVNELAVCASAYQPWLDLRPGNTANGREYCLNRNNTMWPLSRGFWDWQSRCSYMMRQGRPVVDLCIYLGSEISMKILSYRLPVIPEGYDWDVCTDDALLGLMSAEDGKLVTGGGMSYSALVIERLARLEPEAEVVVRRLEEAGVPVYDARVRGDYGLDEFLSDNGILPDAGFVSGGKPDDKLFFAHRSTGTEEIYFFANHSNTSFAGYVPLRNSSGKAVEFWDPLDGSRYSMPSRLDVSGDVSVDLFLAPYESGFVVLLPAEGYQPPERMRSGGRSKVEYSLNEAWNVDFLLPDGKKTVEMPVLADWTSFDDPELKYHSGTAVYRKTFILPEGVPASDSSSGNDDGSMAAGRVFLHIDGLSAVSSVRVNGKEAGLIWCSPWEIDVTDCLVAGNNNLEITVANQLTNRMIGDTFLPEGERYTYATTPLVNSGSRLLPAGITGGVSIVVR